MPTPTIQTTMLIRRPAAEVFQAFIDPTITTKFWFTKSTGRLEAGAQITWTWEMYGASTQVQVKEIEPNQRILISWSGSEENLVEWLFTPRTENETQVTITNTGFTGTEEEKIAQALDSTEGFTIVLCSLKAYLEHGLQLGLIEDKAPQAHVKSWKGR